MKTRNAIGLLALLLAQSIAQGKEARVVRWVDKTIVVRLENACPIAFITYRNTGNRSFLIPPEIPLVLLTNSSGHVVPYIGPIVDGPPFRLDEHIDIKPAASYQVRIDLVRHYGIRRRGRYTVRLNGDLWDPVRKVLTHGPDTSTRFRYPGGCSAGRVVRPLPETG